MAPVVVVVLVVAIGVLGRAGWTRSVSRPSRRPRSEQARVIGALLTRIRGGGGSRDRSTEGEVVCLRSALASGASIPSAFAALVDARGTWGPSARTVVGQLRAGLPQHEVLDRWAARAGGGAELVADALAIASSTGASQVAALDGVLVAFSQRSMLRREVKALASQALASCVVLVTTPIAFGVVVAALDERVRHFYLGSVLGVGCIVVGVALDAAGGWWMLRQVRRVR